jgi:hypothetical protein
MEKSWKMVGYLKFLLGKVAGYGFWWDYSSLAVIKKLDINNNDQMSLASVVVTSSAFVFEIKG